MAFELGGYADKLGNRYEGKWVARQLLALLNEQIQTVTVEAIGDDAVGVDLVVEKLDGIREFHLSPIEINSVTLKHLNFSNCFNPAIRFIQN